MDPTTVGDRLRGIDLDELERLLACLGPDEQRVVRARCLSRLPVSRVAAQLGTDESEVRHLLARALIHMTLLRNHE